MKPSDRLDAAAAIKRFLPQYLETLPDDYEWSDGYLTSDRATADDKISEFLIWLETAPEKPEVHAP